MKRLGIALQACGGQYNITVNYIMTLHHSYKGFRAAAIFASTHRPGVTYLWTWPRLWLTSSKRVTILRCLLIRDCLASVRGTMQYYIELDNNLAFLLQRLPSNGDPCNCPQECPLSCLARQRPQSIGYPYISYLPTARICHFL